VSSLVDMYAKCGSMEDSAWSPCSSRCNLEVLSSWNAILAGSVHGHGKREFEQLDRQCDEGRRILNLANQNHLSFVFCQLVAAIQILWIEGRHALLCFNYLNSHDFLKIGTVHVHAWSSFLAVATQICNTTRQKF
jgi:hypothetical protein